MGVMITVADTSTKSNFGELRSSQQIYLMDGKQNTNKVARISINEVMSRKLLVDLVRMPRKGSNL